MSHHILRAVSAALLNLSSRFLQRPRAPAMWLVLAGLTGLAALGGCSRGPDEANGAIELGRSVRALIAERRAGDPAPLQISRAFLDQFPQPHLEVYVEKSDLTGYLGLVQTRLDDLPGVITTWSAADGSALSFRNGVLIASRGLAGTLISAAVPVQNGRAGPAHGGQRRYYLRSGDNQQRGVTLACRLRDLGSRTVEIYDRVFHTRHMQEDCETQKPARNPPRNPPQNPAQDEAGHRPHIVNDYWVDLQRQTVWKSRQWAGPEIGYLRIRNLAR